MAAATILVVDDDAAQRELLQVVLSAQGYAVTAVRTGAEARVALARSRPDLLILDRGLPDGDGLELCRQLRATPGPSQALPILFLTGQKTLSDKVVGLKMGGDDYLTKPFKPQELLARVEALLRRTLLRPAAAAVLEFGPIQLNLDNRTAQVDGDAVRLTAKEFDLLQAFLERKDRVLTRAFLLSHVWGYGLDVEVTTKALDVAMVGLRRKLGKAGELIETVKGYGYRLRQDI